MIDFHDFECDGLSFAIIAVEPTYDRPVRFNGMEYFREGDSKKRLIEFPDTSGRFGSQLAVENSRMRSLSRISPHPMSSSCSTSIRSLI